MLFKWHKNWWESWRLLVVASMAVVLLYVRMKLLNFSISLKFEFIFSHHHLLRVSKLVNLMFFLRLAGLIILITTLRLII